MSNEIEPRQLFSVVSGFEWTEQRSNAALLLAQGYTIEQTALEVGVTDRTIYNWKRADEFAQEIDRLSLMYGAASKAFRMQLLNRMIRKLVSESGEPVLKDESLLDLLKEARMQTEGTRIDLTTIYTALSAEARSVARSGSAGNDKLIEPGQDSTE